MSNFNKTKYRYIIFERPLTLRHIHILLTVILASHIYMKMNEDTPCLGYGYRSQRLSGLFFQISWLVAIHTYIHTYIHTNHHTMYTKGKDIIIISKTMKV